MRVGTRTLMLSAAVAIWATAPAWSAAGAPGHSHGSDAKQGTQHGDHATGGTATDGSAGKAADVSRTVRIEARDTAYNVKQVQVRAGETLKFVVENKGKLPHEFAIASAEENEAHRKMMQQMPDMVHEEPNMVTLKPGETKEVIWKFGKDTNVEFSCNIPGHAEQGMKGVFRIVR